MSDNTSPIRFIGSKSSLINDISKFIISQTKTKGTFGDFFCGTAIVSSHFKKLGYCIIANDNLFFCSTLAKAVLYNNEYPKFSELMKIKKVSSVKSTLLSRRPYDIVLAYLNQIPLIKNFFYNEYSPSGTLNKKYQRLYFSDKNAQKIDAIRKKIEEWDRNGLLTEGEKALLVSDLIRAANKVANISGTYGFFLKEMKDPRTKRLLILTPSEIIKGNGKKHRVYQEDANKLARRVSCDILYLDPPYNWRHYGAYYHILETIARWDKPKVQNKSGLRPWKDTSSRYSYRNQALKALIELVSIAKSNHIFISYNSEGIISHEDLIKNLKLIGGVKFIEIPHRRYKSNNGGSGKTGITERLYYVKK